jgi:hypothetical protein
MDKRGEREELEIPEIKIKTEKLKRKTSGLFEKPNGLFCGTIFFLS